MHNIQKFLFILLSLLAAPGIQADEVPWYEFEIVIFENLNRDTMSTEVWPADPGLPVLTNAVPIEDPPIQAVSTTGKAPLIPFMAIPTRDMQLQKIADQLKRSKTRRVLIHRGWLQPVYAKEKTIPVYLKGGEEYPAPVVPVTENIPSEFNASNPVPAGTLPTYAMPSEPVMLPQLEGTLSVSVGRYLHVWTDLVFRRQEEAPVLNADGSTQAQLRSYRFIDHRRMRSKEIHYIDNPAFGIIILATPYDDKAKSEASAAQ